MGVWRFLMIRRPPRSTHCISSAASDVYKRQRHHYRLRALDLDICFLYCVNHYCNTGPLEGPVRKTRDLHTSGRLLKEQLATLTS